MDEVSEEAAAFCCTAQAQDTLVNTTCKVEYDGYTSWTLTVAPKGKTVGEGYGISQMLERHYSLTSLCIEIPLRSKLFPYFSFFPSGSYLADGKKIDSGVLNMAGQIPKRLDLPFCAQLYLSGEDTGLAFICESEEHWQYDGYPFEISQNEDETLIKIHLLDSEPKHWQGINAEERRDMPAITFNFNIMVTPVKPLPKNPYEEHSLHIDCAHKISTDYEDFLFENFIDTGEHTGLPAVGVGDDTGEITFDRIERLGVKV